jgi:hypothetical protein
MSEFEGEAQGRMSHTWAVEKCGVKGKRQRKYTIDKPLRCVLRKIVVWKLVLNAAGDDKVLVSVIG